MKTKYVFVTGGVVSGLGKGITAASLGRLLKNRGYKITNQKFDPYINVDPGTMNPLEHGEVFVTDDGAETDLDLGHYERFTDENLSRNSSITMGQIYSSVIEKERKGTYLGKTIQVIPHVTNEIKEKIYSFDGKVDVVITEIGGTIGDLEGYALIEAIRQVGLERAEEDVCYIHVTLLPFISGSKELKSKPTQHSVKELQSFGIKPDILVTRADEHIPENLKDKIGLFCNVRPENVIENLTANSLYEVPLLLEKQGLARAVCKKLGLKKIECENTNWKKLNDRIQNCNKEVNIAIVGKYVKLEDSYLSVAESLRHGGYNHKVKVNIDFVDAEKITEKTSKKILEKYQGIVVPGGFGARGTNGMIETIKYARENNIPFLGICLGMQMAVIEAARNQLKLFDANSEEFDENSKNQVIHIMESQKKVKNKGGTMRLGSYPCVLKEGSLAKKLYKKTEINERHRHRFEYNNSYKRRLEKVGLICSGVSPNGKLVEIVERKDHPYFIASQFHPEFKSRPDRPAPVFDGLINAASKIIK